MPRDGGASASRPGARANASSPSSRSRPKASPPRAKEEWHLVCVTRKGKVSMLKNLDLRSARETYKRLLPGTRPVKHVDPGCAKCGEQHYRNYGHGWVMCSSSDDSDYLSRIEAMGPEGKELDPWHGVEPEIRYYYHCSCPPPPPPWDAKRADFWNNPKLWEGIDPVRQLCWMQ